MAAIRLALSVRYTSLLSIQFFLFIYPLPPCFTSWFIDISPDSCFFSHAAFCLGKFCPRGLTVPSPHPTLCAAHLAQAQVVKMFIPEV